MTIRGWTTYFYLNWTKTKRQERLRAKEKKNEKKTLKKLVCTSSNDKCRAVRFDSISVVLIFFSSTLLLLASSADGSGYSSKLYQSKTIPVDWNCEYFVCVQFGRNRKWVQCRWAKLKQYTIDSLLPGRFSQVRIENQCIVANRVPLSFLLRWNAHSMTDERDRWKHINVNTEHQTFPVLRGQELTPLLRLSTALYYTLHLYDETTKI